MYPLLDTPKPVADDVWIVDSGPLGRWMQVPVRMTVIRLRSGGLWLHSPTRLTPGLVGELAALGPVAHLVAPNSAHWMFAEAWQRAHPDATTWAAPGLRDRRAVRRSGLRIDADLADAPPAAWADEIDQVVVPGGLGFREVAFLHRRTRTAVLTDLVDNLEASRLPAATAALAGMAGSLAPNGRAPVHLRAVLRLRRREAAAAAAKVIAWEPERVVFAHGAWFERDAAPRLRRAMGWLAGD
jgi:Domain of unknown function (DUF4336)